MPSKIPMPKINGGILGRIRNKAADIGDLLTGKKLNNAVRDRINQAYHNSMFGINAMSKSLENRAYNVADHAADRFSDEMRNNIELLAEKIRTKPSTILATGGILGLGLGAGSFVANKALNQYKNFLLDAKYTLDKANQEKKNLLYKENKDAKDENNPLLKTAASSVIKKGSLAGILNNLKRGTGVNAELAKRLNRSTINITSPNI